VSGEPSPLGPRSLVVRPEIGHCNTTRFRLASAGAAALPALVESWEATPSLRHGVAVTFGIMLWYSENTERHLVQADRVVARRHLLRCAVAEEKWLRHAFVEAVDWTNDPSYLALVMRIGPTTATAHKLEGALVTIARPELLRVAGEQWEAMGAEGWVEDAGLQRSVQLALSTIRHALSENDPRTARAALTTLGVNLSAARGRGLRAEAHETMATLLADLGTRV
jgi:hypothetical protein